jgi:hypothetical protein
MKTVLVDWSKSVGDILEEMGKTMHVSIPEEFGLQIEGKGKNHFTFKPNI